jgi:hypothetical protein
MFPDTSTGALNLTAWCLIYNHWRECFVIEAHATDQTALVQIKGSFFEITVPFHRIQNVSLKYDNGEILQSFGAPRVNNPESIAYAALYQWM